MLKKLYIVAAFPLILVPLAAQAPPSAEGSGLTFWTGASVSFFNPDYGCGNNTPVSCWGNMLIGLGPYLDTSSFLFGRIGVEGEARFLRWHGPVSMTQDSYMGGPRVRLFRYKGLHFTGKFLFGLAHLDVPAPLLGGGSYFAFAPGADIDYRLARRLSARVGYEYQRWPEYKRFQGCCGGLTPNGFSVGISYAIHGSGTVPNLN